MISAIVAELSVNATTVEILCLDDFASLFSSAHECNRMSDENASFIVHNGISILGERFTSVQMDASPTIAVFYPDRYQPLNLVPTRAELQSSVSQPI